LLKLTKTGKIYQITVKYTKKPKNMPDGQKIYRPNGHKIYQHLPSQGRPKFTQIGIFGSKTNYLAIQGKE
jgi:hypothetical protein